ncbi:hypothetical protein IGB42_02050 [Andreprevotia sp. IGB-42]|nr:hypothetical protein IGB42_02050 [Andreprevotia sp. IGB-42]
MGALIALPVVLGFQAVAGKTNMLHRGWLFFFYAAISCTTSGLAAVILAIRGAGLAPHAFLFLVLGMAMFAGLGIVNTLFRRKT